MPSLESYRPRSATSAWCSCAALGSLGEIGSMVRVLPDLYSLDAVNLAKIDGLRIRVTRGIFRLLRVPGR